MWELIGDIMVANVAFTKAQNWCRDNQSPRSGLKDAVVNSSLKSDQLSQGMLSFAGYEPTVGKKSLLQRNLQRECSAESNPLLVR